MNETCLLRMSNTSGYDAILGLRAISYLVRTDGMF